MRILIAVILLCSFNRASTQITLEHTYPDAGFWHGRSALLMIELEASGLKYVLYDHIAKEIRFYHLDHSVYKTVSFSTAPPHPAASDGLVPDIMYISEHLFDMDDDIEFMYLINHNQGYSTTIIDEDGSFLLSAPQEVPMVRLNIPTQQFPIYNTPTGTKLILSRMDSTCTVYSLPGELSVAMMPNLESMLPSADVKIYPNPSARSITIDLGTSVRTHSRLVLYDALGGRSKEVALNGESSLTIPIDDLATGQYYVVLSGSGGMVPCGSFIKE